MNAQKKLKIKQFTDSTYTSLEILISSWLKDVSANIVDIKYSTCCQTSGYIRSSVLIFYYE